MASQIMSDIGEWCELESDPGLFTLLCEEFKVTGVEVEEIYDLEKAFEFDAFGFIFLFKWTDERKARRNRYCGANESIEKCTSSGSPNVSSADVVAVSNTSAPNNENTSNSNTTGTSTKVSCDDGDTNTSSKVEEAFFAHQVVTNSCATHALLSILLNCDSRPNVHIGELLTDFREFTRKLSPEDRGYAIGSTPKLVEIHNRHARHERRNPQASATSKPSPTLPNGSACMQKQEDNDAFHYVSFVPVNGRLMELDGLRDLPVDHGPVNSDGPYWTEHFRRIIRIRVGLDREPSEEDDNGTSETKTNSESSAAANEIQPGDIRYNLMAVVPDKRVLLRDKLTILRTNKYTINLSLVDLVSRSQQEVSREDIKMETECLTPLTSPMVPDGQDEESEAPFLALREQVEKIKDSPLKVSVTQVVERNDGDGPLMQPCTTVASTDVTKPLHIAVADVMPQVYDIVTPSKSATSKNSSANANGSSISHWTNLFAGSPTSSISCLPPRESPTSNTATSFSPTPSPSSQASATTSRSKYSTRSSTRLNTIASNSLANARNDTALIDRVSSHKGFSPEELLELAEAVFSAIKECDVQLREQEIKRKKYLVDDERRRHDYSEFIHTFVHMLVESGRWTELEQQLREESRESKDRENKETSAQNDQRYSQDMRARARRNVRRKNTRSVGGIQKLKHRPTTNSISRKTRSATRTTW